MGFQLPFPQLVSLPDFRDPSTVLQTDPRHRGLRPNLQLFSCPVPGAGGRGVAAKAVAANGNGRGRAGESQRGAKHHGGVLSAERKGKRRETS